MIEVVLSVLLVLGGLFGLIGSYGLLRLKQPMQRLHSTTKASTVGVGAVLIASVLGGQSWHEVLITLFLFVTAPITAIYLARTHLTSQDLPPTGNGSTWSQQDPNTKSL